MPGFVSLNPAYATGHAATYAVDWVERSDTQHKLDGECWVSLRSTQPTPSDPAVGQVVGWVERSDTRHKLDWECRVSFPSTQPSPLSMAEHGKGGEGGCGTILSRLGYLCQP